MVFRPTSIRKNQFVGNEWASHNNLFVFGFIQKILAISATTKRSLPIAIYSDSSVAVLGYADISPPQNACSIDFDHLSDSTLRKSPRH
jgi:hypothetical protein